MAFLCSAVIGIKAILGPKGIDMTFPELAQLVAPFVAVLTASAWLHGTIASLRETIAMLSERVRYLEAEVERLRGMK